MTGPDWNTGGLSLQVGRRESICFARIDVLVYTLGLIYIIVIGARLGLIFRPLHVLTNDGKTAITFYCNIRALNAITSVTGAVSTVSAQITILFMP
jgi:hypothetical protein